MQLKIRNKISTSRDSAVLLFDCFAKLVFLFSTVINTFGRDVAAMNDYSDEFIVVVCILAFQRHFEIGDYKNSGAMYFI